MTQRDILNAIGYTLYDNPSYYSTKASLVLVQGVLSGFFTTDEELAWTDDSYPEWYYLNSSDGYYLDGYYDTYAYGDTSLSAGEDTYVMLATGRHFDPISYGYPAEDYYDNGNPPGHLQPWGQIFMKDPANAHVTGTPRITRYVKMSPTSSLSRFRNAMIAIT